MYKGYVYQLTNKLTGKVAILTTPATDITSHINSILSGEVEVKKTLLKDLLKGTENFELAILCDIQSRDVVSLEKYLQINAKQQIKDLKASGKKVY